MSKIIFTADDYGVIPAIDKGIIKAAKARKINSVAAFSNHKDAKESIKRLIDESENPDLEIGCHLTITSGEPILKGNLKRLCRRNGSFRNFTNLRRPRLSKRVKEIKELEDELKAQIDQLGEVTTVKHLSSHHNSLYFFEDYADTLFAVANGYNLPVRSPIIKPKKKHNLFIFQLVLRLFENMNIRDRRHIQKFMKHYEDYLARRTNVPTMPKYGDIRHYGPAPFPLFDLDVEEIEECTEDKVNSMMSTLAEGHGEGTVEYIFHLIDNDINRLDEYMNQVEEKNYSGVNADYFDARIAEFNSVMQIVVPNGVGFHSWGNL